MSAVDHFRPDEWIVFERIKWTAVGVGVWILVGMIVSRASGEMQDLQIEASAQESVEQAARAEAEIPRTRAKLDRTPERRRAVLDSTLAQAKGEIVVNYRAAFRSICPTT